MKRIITIQHTQSQHHNTEMLGSWTDWDLTMLGARHAENIGRKLARELAGETWKIYSSDLIRARKTVEPLATHMNAKIFLMRELREGYLGEEAIGQTKQWLKENAAPVNSFDEKPFTSAESWREFWTRITNLRNIIIADEAKHIILASHGVTLSIWQQVWRGEDIQPFNYLGLPGGVSFYTVSDTGEREIVKLNDATYMQD